MEDFNETTILYSGNVYPNVNLDTYRYIIHTDAANVIGDPSFTNIISELIKCANCDIDGYTATVLAKRYINGEEIFENFVPTGIESNGTTGPWAIVSRNFAAETKGPVVAYIGDDIDDISKRILMNTELPAILEQSSATSINGVSVDIYKYCYEQLTETRSQTDALYGVLNIAKATPVDNANANYLDNMVYRLDYDGKLTSVDIKPLYGDDIDSLIYDSVRGKDLFNDYQYCCELKAGDLNRIVSSADGNYEKAISLIQKVGYDSTDAIKLLDATDNNFNSAIKILDSSSGDVDGAIQVLNRSSGDIDSAVDIINRSGKNTSNALGVIDAAKGDVKGAIKTLDVTSNNHADAVKMLKSASGDADGAIKVFNKVGKDADIASAVLNKSDGSAVKALDSIDEAKRSVILYLNDDGIEIGHSYKNTGLEGILPDAIPSESKFSIRKMDLDNLPDDVSLSGKIPMYEKLCAADKIQLRYIEGRHLNGEFSDAAVVSVTLDSNGKSKVSYDVNGRVETGEIDAGAIRYDVDMNGKISVKCRDTVDGTAGWKSQVGDMIHDSRIESINGIDRAQFSSLDDALKKLDVSDTSKLFGDSISKISSDNTNSMRFVMDVATGRNNFADSVKLDPVNCSKIGARVGVAMAALDTLGDLGDGIDAIIAYNKFAEGLVNGDYVEAA